MPDVEEDAALARREGLGPDPPVLVQQAAVVAVEAVRDDVARAQLREQLGQRHPHVDHVHHQRQAERVGGLEREADRGPRVRPDHLVARAQLDAGDHVAVRLGDRARTARPRPSGCPPARRRAREIMPSTAMWR